MLYSKHLSNYFPSIMLVPIVGTYSKKYTVMSRTNSSSCPSLSKFYNAFFLFCV